ncbi:MAG: hypothetical protein C4K49_12175 [Candidatus Thorarchaeota archaeon]|nr:MAG: hypothetical protein C4K49_12175 [Candidatus Thorarchaeota archaeon]
MQFPFDYFFGLFGAIGLMFIIVPLIMLVVAIVVIFKVCSVGSQAVKGVLVDAPQFAIPERYRGSVRSDGSEIRTVRLPERCPSCGAAIAQEHIDWVGPLEARCNYCGSTVRAQLERI